MLGQKACTLATQQTQVFTQQRCLRQQGLHQRLAVCTGRHIQAVVVHQGFIELQQLVHQLGVLGHALGRSDRAARHGGLQLLPAAHELFQLLGDVLGRIGLLQFLLGLGQQTADGITQGRAALGHGGIPAEHAGRSATVGLQALHGRIDSHDGRHALCLAFGLLHGLNQGVHIKAQRQQHHQKCNTAKDQKVVGETNSLQPGRHKKEAAICDQKLSVEKYRHFPTEHVTICSNASDYPHRY